MGLFGGFKAKFTKDTTAKATKNDKKNEVVCLKYRVYSEFDSPTNVETSPNALNKPTVLKTSISQPNITNIAGHSNLSTASSPVVSNNNSHVKKSTNDNVELSQPKRNNFMENSNESNMEAALNNDNNNTFSFSYDKMKANTSHSKTENLEKNKKLKSILKMIPPDPNETNFAIKKSHKNDERNVNQVSMTTESANSIRTPKEVTPAEIINETSNNNDYYYSNNNEIYGNNSAFGYTSNQAASIFFDGEEEPQMQQRPRRLNLDVVQNHDERRRSADC